MNLLSRGNFSKVLKEVRRVRHQFYLVSYQKLPIWSVAFSYVHFIASVAGQQRQQRLHMNEFSAAWIVATWFRKISGCLCAKIHV